MGKTELYKSKIRTLARMKYFYIFLSICLTAIITVLTAYIIKSRGQLEKAYSLSGLKGTAPYAKEINEIIANFRYSGLAMFEREDVYLSIDFENKIWKLHNLHRFDNKGDIILEDGKYGTCGELAAHTYKKIEPLLGKDYDIKFVETAQSGFFLSPKASHIVLYITEKSGLWRGRDKKIYILDASFHKYGPIGDFEDYLFLEFMSTLPFVERKETDIAMPLSKSIPLLIKDNLLMGFVVEDNDGEFDAQNFTIALTMTKRFHFAGRYLFAIRYNHGRVQIFENKMLGEALLGENKYQKLCNKMKFLFEKISSEKILK